MLCAVIGSIAIYRLLVIDSLAHRKKPYSRNIDYCDWYSLRISSSTSIATELSESLLIRKDLYCTGGARSERVEDYSRRLSRGYDSRTLSTTTIIFILPVTDVLPHYSLPFISKDGYANVSLPAAVRCFWERCE